VISISRLICVGCGSETNATSDCGLEYRPKSVRAREAVEANPEKSNRAIAEETGLSEATVRRARASSDAPETVAGKDGKSNPAKREPRPEYQPPPDSLAERFREHLSAAYQILDAEDWLPPDVTSEELRLRSQMKSNLDWQVLQFERLLSRFKWPIEPSEESRKLVAELKERAWALGCTIKKKGRQYEVSGGANISLVTLDGIARRLDEIEGKLAVQVTTGCGMPIPGINNAQAVERYEKATGSIVPRPDNWTLAEDDLSIPDYLKR
jgi:hypothetical protein